MTSSDENAMEIDYPNPKLVVQRVPVVFDKEKQRKAKDLAAIGAFCLVGNEAEENVELLDAIRLLGIPMRVFAEIDDEESNFVYVCDPFDGAIFSSLFSSKQRILGPSCVIDAAKSDKRLPRSSRPVYCNAMEGLDVCFTGFKSRDELTLLCHLVHFMGGSVKKDFGTKVTHLISKTVSGPKYRAAVALGLPIMSAEWLHKCWEHRKNRDFRATEESMNAWKQSPFCSCHLGFVGFPLEEKQHMEEITRSNGGQVVDPKDSSCTHIVVMSEEDAAAAGLRHPSQVAVVKQDWFWESVAMAACADESFYRLNKDSSSPCTRSRSRRTAARDIRSVLGNLGGLEAARFQRKRRSVCGASFDDEDAENSAMNSTADVLGSLLEASIVSLTSLPGARSKDHLRVASAVPDVDRTEKPSDTEKHEMARRQIASEMLQTERNYVTILDVILTVFKEPLESSSQRGGPILPLEDVKAIFSSIPDILKVHAAFMESLSCAMELWSADTDLGTVVLEHSDNFSKVYPKFVNFFEMTKKRIRDCEKQYPRFLAFLKWNYSKPQCGRQTLAELLIVPVQRIPRIILLLQELLKHTPESMKQRATLEEAIAKVKTVVSHINEDKRKTENQMQLFEMMGEIEGCPADVLSAQRSLVVKIDAFEVGENLGSKGEFVTLFLLSDSCEIAKRRASWIPSPIRASAVKEYKHLDFIQLPYIKALLDIKDTDDFSDLFGLVTRSAAELNERVLVFRLSQPSPLTKSQLLQQFQQQITLTGGGGGGFTSPDGCIKCVDGLQLLDMLGKRTTSHAEKGTGSSSRHKTLHRAFRGAKHKAKRVRRALSQHLSKTSKRSIRASMKSVGSPVFSQAEDAADKGTPVKKRKFGLKVVGRSLGRSSVTLV